MKRQLYLTGIIVVLAIGIIVLFLSILTSKHVKPLDNNASPVTDRSTVFVGSKVKEDALPNRPLWKLAESNEMLSNRLEHTANVYAQRDDSNHHNFVRETNREWRAALGIPDERVSKVDVQVVSLVVASQEFQKHLGVFPTGDSHAVSAALMGKNEKGVVFIEGYGWTNNMGELIDPWGTPYSFGFESNSVTVRSSGPNKVFGDTDDVIRVKSCRQKPL